MYREIVFELLDGKAATPLFQALSEDPSGRARLQATSVGPDAVSVLIDYHGPPSAVGRLRGILARKPEPMVLHYDTLLDGDDHVRFVATWRRPAEGSEDVSLEHHLHDHVGPGGLLFGRVQGGVVAYKAAAPGGRGIPEFLASVEAAFAGRFRLRVLRSGPYRPGWEIEDAAASVRPEETALLLAAFSAGYYDEPRRCGVRELGDALGVSKSVVARRLRVLERRALERMVSPRPAPLAASEAVRGAPQGVDALG